ncbi:MAG TPA: nodulation protein NfeD [Bryobacteraceae bacterium]|nr:nodulation protein NfeD [Bryobacteraceae bacterium]HOL72504.1 nodulation protein NfeD [Bryobacteraceae bacterium]HOQ45419.1 nodulation protein NfeD [Bryobacteraceae bacterium]HPQ14625.1 nodulation protein NfeD [Bryobacteraceae bacterium]HPU73944.1 nodulation protein NfeD [Bryobacteraceae bacterium]
MALALACFLITVQAAFARTKIEAVKVDGVVHPVTVDIINRAIEEAKREGAEIILIRLNTPGGMSEATREIVQAIVASPIPVVTFVEPSGGRAASAGFFILQAGDVAAMAPGTNTGAATPVLMGGGQMDETMAAKVRNDAAASIRSLTAKRGRNSQLAEQTVLESKSFTEEEALKNNLIDVVASNEAELFQILNGREITRFDGRKQTLQLTAPEVIEYEKTIREKIVSAISDPNVALVLLVLGVLGIYIEFSAPGLIVPGVAGAILALMGLSALSVLPINWTGAALLVLAIVLFILEAKFATQGILAIGGTAAMILGALLLVESPLPEMRVRPGTAIGLALPFAIITTFLLSLVIRARASKVITGTVGMLGEIGVAHTPLEPSGKVFVHGEYWDAISSSPVRAGERVRVRAIEGLTLKVDPEPDGDRSGKGT